MPRNRHYGLAARLRLGKLSDGLVPQIVEPEPLKGLGDARLATRARLAGILEKSAPGTLNCPRESPPCRPPTLDAARAVDMSRLASREEEMARLSASERL
jgi:hypothetical protein